MFGRLVRVAALSAAIGTLSVSAYAQGAAPQPAGKGEDPVVARVNGQEIKRSEVMRVIAGLPPQVQQMPPQMIFPAVIDQMINGKLVAAAAFKQDLAKDSEVKDRLKRAEERIVQEIYLTRAVRTRITEDKLKQAYQEFLKENPAEEEVKASHILVASQEEAQAIIQQVKGGADFAQLARDKSTDKAAAAQGGDLGYFSRKDMVEPFAEAAFGLKPGAITETPVQTQFGWHIIKVEDRRMSQPPTFEQVKDQLEGELSQDIIGEIVDELRSKAKVERFAMDGSPLPAEGKAEGKAEEPKKK